MKMSRNKIQEAACSWQGGIWISGGFTKKYYTFGMLHPMNLIFVQKCSSLNKLSMVHLLQAHELSFVRYIKKKTVRSYSDAGLPDGPDSFMPNPVWKNANKKSQASRENAKKSAKFVGGGGGDVHIFGLIKYHN